MTPPDCSCSNPALNRVIAVSRCPERSNDPSDRAPGFVSPDSGLRFAASELHDFAIGAAMTGNVENEQASVTAGSRPGACP